MTLHVKRCLSVWYVRIIALYHHDGLYDPLKEFKHRLKGNFQCISISYKIVCVQIWIRFVFQKYIFESHDIYHTNSSHTIDAIQRKSQHTIREMGSRKRPYYFYEQSRFHEYFVPTKYAWILFWIWLPFPVCKRNYCDPLFWFMTTKYPLNLILNISKQKSHKYPQSPLSHKMRCWSSYFIENMSVT